MLKFSFYTISVLNVLWFSAAFHYFSIKRIAAAKVLVPKSSRESPLFVTVAASLRFLGGMNFAFAVLSALLLFGFIAATDISSKAFLLMVIAIAHASQFYFNVPILMGGGRQGESLWEVKTGPMRFIFVVDATLMVANAVLCIVYFALK
jgi:hypothetical protein